MIRGEAEVEVKAAKVQVVQLVQVVKLVKLAKVVEVEVDQEEMVRPTKEIINPLYNL